MLTTLLLSLSLLWVAQTPPPTPPPGMPASDWRQLTTASDGSPSFDEGALYPLLRYLMTQPRARESAQAGAVVPDYPAMLQHPKRYRGEKFLLEGQFPGRPRPIGLARSGPWGDTLTEWGLLVDRAASSPPEGDVVLVYLVDPEGKLARPRIGQHLRLTGRFYKVWTGRDLNNQPTRYLTFLARSTPGVVARGQKSGPSGGSENGLGKMGSLTVALVLVAGGLVVWRLLRSRAKAAPTTVHQRRAGRRRHDREAMEAQATADSWENREADDAPLPDDPADAMAELERRHEPGQS